MYRVLTCFFKVCFFNFYFYIFYSSKICHSLLKEACNQNFQYAMGDKKVKDTIMFATLNLFSMYKIISYLRICLNKTL